MSDIHQMARGPQPGHTGSALLRDFYAAFARGDEAAASAFVTPDFVMHVSGRGLNAGEYWGPDGLKRFMSNIRAYNDGVFSVVVSALAVSGHTAFTREVVTLNRKSDPLQEWTLRFMMHYEFKNGLISEAWTIPEDQYVYDAYWSPGTSLQRKDSDRATDPPVVAEGLADPGSATSTTSMAMIRAFYDRFWKGDTAGMQQFAAPDMTFHVPGRSHLAGDYQGWRGYLAFRDKLLALAGDKYKLEIAAMAASETDVFVKEHIRMNRNWDPEVKTSFVILHFEIRDGRIGRINDIPVDTYAYEAFFKLEETA